MLPKSQKIKRSLFNEVFLFGKNKNTDYFRVKIRKSDSLKFGFVISKKICKKAVERNAMKRLFFNIIKDLHFEPELAEYIFISQKPIKGKTKEEIKEDVINFLKK